MFLKFSIFSICLLAPLTYIRAGDVQPVEFFLTFFMLCLLFYVVMKEELFMPRELRNLTKNFAWFILIAFMLAFVSLHLHFFPPSAVKGHLLKKPFIISMSRLYQFGLLAGSMTALASVLAEDSKLVSFLASMYVSIGIANAIFAIVSWCALYYLGIALGGAYTAPDTPSIFRARAFFNEGGPYGIYAASVILVTIFRRIELGELSNWSFVLMLSVLSLSLFLSGSQAGFLCLATIGMWWAIRSISFRWLMLVLTVITIAFWSSSGPKRVLEYWNGYELLEFYAAERPHDTNIVTGRVASLYIIPRMVADHPLLGVGFGHHPLMRNNPKYLGVLPEYDTWEIPGMGFLGYVGELGLPLFGYLLWMMWRPVSICKRLDSADAVAVLGSFQFFAGTFGVQVTFFYPWILTALTLGHALGQHRFHQK